MQKSLLLILLVTFFLLGGCKKDLLHFQSVQKINSYTGDDRLNKILFTDSKTGFIVGGQRFYDAVILTTHDGGYTWQKNSYPVAGKGLYDIVQAPSGALYTCGFDGKLLRSYDMGQTWSFTQLYFFNYTGIAFTNATQALVVGGVSFSSGIIQHIDSGGSVTGFDSLAYQFNKIKMANDQTGYICGYGVVIKTTDGARTWKFLDVKGDNFTGMDVHGDEIWMCGYNGGIYHTANGGYHWDRLRNGNDITVAKYHLNSIVFKDPQNGWAVGEDGKLIYTDDGGKHWAEYDRFTSEILYSIAICPNGDLLVAGEHGALYRIMLK